MDVTKRVPGRKLEDDENISAKQVFDHNLHWKQLQKKLQVLQVGFPKLINYFERLPTYLVKF